jgi:hypothetical protein
VFTCSMLWSHCKMADITENCVFLERTQPLNSMVNSRKNSSSSFVVLLRSGGRGRKDFSNQHGRKTLTFFLQLSTCWWQWQIVHDVFKWTLDQSTDSMYGPKFHSLNGGNILNQQTLIIIYYNILSYCKAQKMNTKCENLRLRNLKLGFHCTIQMQKIIPHFSILSAGICSWIAEMFFCQIMSVVLKYFSGLILLPLCQMPN